MKNSSGYILAFLFAGIWGMTFVWTQGVLEVYSPLNMIFVRMFLASLFLFIYVIATKKLQKIQKKDWKLLVLIAFLEPFIYFLGETYGIHYTGAGFSAIMIAVIPLITPFVSRIILKTHISWNVWLGLLISFLGVLLLVLGENFSLEVDPLGLGFLIMAVLAAVFYAIFIQKAVQHYNNYTIVFYQTFFGTILFLPLFLIFGLEEYLLLPLQWNIIRDLCLLAILGSGVAFICFVQAIRKIGAVRAYLFTNLIPIVTAIGAYFILGESLSTRAIMGMGIVIVGLCVAQIKKKVS